MTPDARPDDGDARWLSALPGALEQPLRKHLTDDEAQLRDLLEELADIVLKPEDWDSPYGPMFVFHGRRSRIPDDLDEVELGILRAVQDQLPTWPLRVRVLDVLAFRATGRAQVDGYGAMVAAVAEGLAGIDLEPDILQHCDRALLVALRFRNVLGEQGQKLLTALLDRLFAPREDNESIWISDLLLRQGLAGDRALDIATDMRRRSDSAPVGTDRSYREGAAAWHRIAGATHEAHVDIAWAVLSLKREAEALLTDGNPDAALRAGSDLENALQLLRTIPKAERAICGLAGVSEQIAASISSASANAIGMLRVMRSEPVDISGPRKEAAEAVSGVATAEAIHTFLRFLGVTDYEALKGVAEQALEDRPLSRLFPITHLSSDGRVTGHTNRSPGEKVYGLSTNLWRTMVERYQQRVGLVAASLITPAWITLSNEHRLPATVFHDLTRRSPLVPPDRARMTAQALYYGYNGDFLTAAQLLAPQVENIVRVQLVNAGVQTRVFEDGKQNEKGLSALVEGDEIVEILGVDVAFEIRALFCSPLGPNLRNEYAHGLVGDDARNSASAIYAWWFVWKLIDAHFANHMHDVKAAEAREPGTPIDDSEDAASIG